MISEFAPGHPFIEAFRQGVRKLGYNGRTDRSLGLTIPQSLLLQADQVLD